MSSEDLISQKTAAEILGISYGSFRVRLCKGNLPIRRFKQSDGRCYFRRREVEVLAAVLQAE